MAKYYFPLIGAAFLTVLSVACGTPVPTGSSPLRVPLPPTQQHAKPTPVYENQQPILSFDIQTRGVAITSTCAEEIARNMSDGAFENLPSSNGYNIFTPTSDTSLDELLVACSQ